MFRKLNVILAIIASITFFAQAQTKTLKATYRNEIKISDEYNKIEDESIREALIKKEKENSQRFVLYYCDGISGFAPLPNKIKDNKFLVSGENSVYINLKLKETIWQNLLLGKSLIVKDSLRSTNWSIGEETKIIANKSCKKATDTITQSIAWFCADIPIQVGPEEYYGLPGLIMEVETIAEFYFLEEVEFLNTTIQILAPSKGKVLTREEFFELQDKKLKELGIPEGQSEGIIITINEQ